MIIVKQDGKQAAVKFHTFSGGEEHVNVTLPNVFFKRVDILARIDSSSELIRLLLVTDAIKRLGVVNIHLILPYIPYARQDRVCAPGDAFSLKFFANLINSQGYTKVHVTDAHSSVSTALLDNVVEMHQSEFVKKLYINLSEDIKYEYLVAPDAGASKKAVEFARNLSNFVKLDVVQALKIRDVSTGNITKTEVLREDFNGRACLMIDDICDGGRTFIELAKILKEKQAGKIGLFVTHGIFSQGVDVLFNQGIDEIYTTDSFAQTDSRVKVIYNFYS